MQQQSGPSNKQASQVKSLDLYYSLVVCVRGAAFNLASIGSLY